MQFWLRSLFDAKVVDITSDVLPKKLITALNVISKLTLMMHLPMEASVTHSAANTFKAHIAYTVELEKFTLETVQVHKSYLANSSVFASSSSGSGTAATRVVVEEEVANTRVETTKHHACTLLR